MLSRGVRLVHRLTAVAYLGFGGLLFLAPSWAAERFPWTISPFVAMTIGGWCLGVTAFSWIGGRRGPVGAVLPVLVFVWLFGLSELAVLYVEKPVFESTQPLAVPYVLSLALTLAGGAFGLRELAVTAGRGRDGAATDLRLGPRARAVLAALALALASIAIGAGLAEAVSPATSGRIFPEAVTLFTVRAFGALALSLAAGALVAAVRASREATAWLGLAALFLLGPTLIAALANAAAFDLANRPLGGLYLGGLVVLMLVAAPAAWSMRVRISPVAQATNAGASAEA